MAKAGHWETEKAAQEPKIHESEELRKKIVCCVMPAPSLRFCCVAQNPGRLDITRRKTAAVSEKMLAAAVFCIDGMCPLSHSEPGRWVASSVRPAKLQRSGPLPIPVQTVCNRQCCRAGRTPCCRWNARLHWHGCLPGKPSRQPAKQWTELQTLLSSI